ncbi:hypothetical protein RchiOBHm_Chr5g0063981 [Rosa chinensis]|uniref:Uncharacterized protein n=1 Tax=Rosa chinensis TaxID=74649 RepID=A0A2P6QIJ4_ROSCH|nr:hypothetical protein RchiOBHm_Chr5g0063981 [Rosa chinensis]
MSCGKIRNLVCTTYMFGAAELRLDLIILKLGSWTRKPLLPILLAIRKDHSDIDFIVQTTPRGSLRQIEQYFSMK